MIIVPILVLYTYLDFSILLVTGSLVDCAVRRHQVEWCYDPEIERTLRHIRLGKRTRPSQVEVLINSSSDEEVSDTLEAGTSVEGEKGLVEQFAGITLSPQEAIMGEGVKANEQLRGQLRTTYKGTMVHD